MAWHYLRSGEKIVMVNLSVGNVEKEHLKGNGLLSSVKKRGKRYMVSLESEWIKHFYGHLAEDLLTCWAIKNKEIVVRPFIKGSRLRTLVQARRRKGRKIKIRSQIYRNLQCDLLFVINQPNSGMILVLFEAKYGKAPISGEQAQYYHRVTKHPEIIHKRAKEAHVVLAKCYDIDLKSGKMSFYMGELVVPSEKPNESSDFFKGWDDAICNMEFRGG